MNYQKVVPNFQTFCSKEKLIFVFLWPLRFCPINRSHVLQATHNPTQQQVQAMMRSFIHAASFLSCLLSSSLTLPILPCQDALLCLTESNTSCGPWWRHNMLPHLLEETGDIPQQTNITLIAKSTYFSFIYLIFLSYLV